MTDRSVNKFDSSKQDSIFIMGISTLPGAANQHEKPVSIASLPRSQLRDFLRSIEGAAVHSRLPYKMMTESESVCFPDIVEAGASAQKLFLNIRNRLLQLWLEDPENELTFESALKAIGNRKAEPKTMVLRVHAFLQRYGFINFGNYTRKRTVAYKKNLKVIIIGAGIAGLAAARQMKLLGIEVVILEARNTIGGRIATFRKTHSIVADLGPMVVCGAVGNPIAVLSRQMSIDRPSIKSKCPLYNDDGKEVPKHKIDMMQQKFTQIRKAAEYFAENLQKTSLGKAMEWVIALRERAAKAKYTVYRRSVALNDSVLSSKRKKLDIIKTELLKSKEEYEKIAGQSSAQENYKNAVYKQWKNSYSQFRDAVNDIFKTEELFVRIYENPPDKCFISSSDRPLLDWFFASEELRLPLDKAPLKNLRDTDFKFMGSQSFFHHGYSAVPMHLAAELDISLNTAVKNVSYGTKGVEVSAKDLKTHHSFVCQGDAVLCTLPLGVLKVATTSKKEAPKPNTVTFEPPLPVWKTLAIQSLDSGSENKVVLVFDRFFWDTRKSFFGHVSGTTSSRGEFFVFHSSSQAPVLVASSSGVSAQLFEGLEDAVIVAHCLAVLRKIFGANKVPVPQQTIVTRWGSNIWSRGTSSFPARGSSAEDYRKLADPVYPTTKQGGPPLPRIFFAGEHTICGFAGTVHGAFLSGLREAGRIADYFLGPIDGTPNNVSYSVLDAANAASVGAMVYRTSTDSNDFTAQSLSN